MTILSNGELRVEVSAHGAELQSIRKGETEYLWQGDPAFWGRRSPVLFPIVGSVWESRYRVEGAVYQMGQHGFARDMDFTLVNASETEVRYRLESSVQTKEKYPYDFCLEIAYRLRGRCLDVIWEVTNPSAEDIYFQIGAHPAFYYPDYDPQTSGRGHFTFDRSEGLECIRIKEKGCVDAETKWPLELCEGVLKLEKDTFDAIDTIMLQDSQVGRVNMFREDGSPWLSLSFDAPVVGIWSPPGKIAPFICIEPWYGRCDRAGFEGDYREKDWMNRLASREKFESVYTIEIA
jgi:galactose mutarotase-like enzyme